MGPYDQAAGRDTGGAYPAQRDGTWGNPPGMALGCTYNLATGSDISGEPIHRTCGPPRSY